MGLWEQCTSTVKSEWGLCSWAAINAASDGGPKLAPSTKMLAPATGRTGMGETVVVALSIWGRA